MGKRKQVDAAVTMIENVCKVAAGDCTFLYCTFC